MPGDTTKLQHISDTGLISAIFLLTGACAGTPAVDMSSGHLAPQNNVEFIAPIPLPAKASPPPAAEAEDEVPQVTYTVVVKDVPAVDILFSLARDAGLQLDMQADSSKTVTLNAVDRPLREILARISEQARFRYDLRGSSLLINNDLPFWRNYLVDYVNISRTSEGEVGVATQISTTGGSVAEDGRSQGDAQGNLSKTVVKSTSQNDFWVSLEEGLEAILASTAEAGAAKSPAENDAVIINQMSGVVTVFASQKQHHRIDKHLKTVMSNSQRQVLIEMTIVEIELSDRYKAGVDWQRLSSAAGIGSNGVTVRNSVLGPELTVPPFFSLGYNDDDPNGSNVSATIRLLQQFGNTKVLSSPKIMALNNQTALLKVVNENVYFTVELDIRDATADIPERRTFTSEIHTVPVGLVLSVTPQISKNGLVSLNIRPTISRITGFAVDPAPRLAGSTFDNLIPEIQVREIESLLQVRNGRTVVLGGLMQNERESSKSGVPGLSRIPKLGKLFSYDSDDVVKTELVIFLKPTIVNNGVHPGSAAQVADYYDPAAEQQPISNVEYR